MHRTVYLSPLFALLFAHASTATALDACQSPEIENEDSQRETLRRRLSAWVPTLTLEASNQLRHTAADDLELSTTETSMRTGIARFRGIDWQVSANWNIQAIFRSLAPTNDTVASLPTRECRSESSRAAPNQNWEVQR